MDDVKFKYGSESDYEGVSYPESGTFYAVGDFSPIQAESINDSCHLYVGGKRVVGTDPLSPAFDAFVTEKSLSADTLCTHDMWTECVQVSGLSGIISDGVYGVYADCRIDTSFHTMSFSGCCVSIIAYSEGDEPSYDVISTQCIANPDGHSVSLFGVFRYRHGNLSISYDRISLAVYPVGSSVTACKDGFIPSMTNATKIGIFRIGNIPNSIN